MRSIILRIAWMWIVPAAFLAWEAVSRMAGAVYFPPPSAILVRLHELWFSGPLRHAFLTQEALDHLLPSLGRLVLGWAGACVVAIAAGSRWAGRRCCATSSTHWSTSSARSRRPC